MAQHATTETAHNSILRADILREADAAKYLGVSRSFLRIGRMHGRGPAYVKLSTRALGYRLCDLDQWVSARVVRPRAA